MGYRERERERKGNMCSRQRGTSLSLWWQQHLGCVNVTTVAAERESQCELEVTRKLPGGFIRERWERCSLSTNICSSLFEMLVFSFWHWQRSTMYWCAAVNCILLFIYNSHPKNISPGHQYWIILQNSWSVVTFFAFCIYDTVEDVMRLWHINMIGLGNDSCCR